MEAGSVENISGEAIEVAVKKKKVWICDVCREAKFDDFKEACRHEIECLEQTKARNVICIDDHHLHLEEEKDLTEPVSRPRRKKRKSDEQSQNSKSNGNNDDIVEVLENSAKPSSQPEESATLSKTEKSGNWLTSASNKPKRVTRSTVSQEGRTSSRDSKNSLTFFNEKKEDGQSKPTKSKESKATKVNTTAKKAITAKHKNAAASSVTAFTNKTAKSGISKSTKEKAPSAKTEDLTCFFAGVDSKKLMAEHLAAEFQAKRLEKQERERERQLRREQAFQEIAAQKAAKVILLDDDDDQATKNRVPSKILCDKKPQPPTRVVKPKPRKKSLPRAPRFPNPTHVVPIDSSDTALPTTKSAYLMDYERGMSPPLLLPESLDLPPLFPVSNSFWSSCVADADPVSDKISCLVLSIRQHPVCTDSSDTLQMWAEKYRISKLDLQAETGRGISATIQVAADKLRSFVGEWKCERHKANQRAAERQRKLVEPKRRIKRHRKRACEDDGWLSDEEGDDTLPSLMLISGPVASGKTSLVHAVTAQCECKVLEINTSEKRSGAALKQMLKEATQSHSSIDLLNKTNRVQEMWSGGALVDSDDEDDEGETRGDNLAVILIDEVDLLYEQDSGFWGALAELTKRTKCPIVLTSNSVPSELNTFRYNHIELERPSAAECAARMKHILVSEGLAVGTSVDEALLQSCAESFHGDMRRFCYELQTAFECDSISSKQEYSSVPSSSPVFDVEASQVHWDDNLASLPVIESIKPDFLPAHEYSLFTLTGTGFLSLVSLSSRRSDSAYRAIVHVNGQECPEACILDDTTAIAVCPPVKNTSNGQRMIQCVFDDDIESEFQDYVPVTLSSVQKRGMLSTTSASLQINKLVDGTRVTSNQRMALLEIRFSQKNSIEVSESAEIVSCLIKEGVDAWMSRNGECPDAPLSAVNPCSSDASRMEDAERLAQLASDAALLELGLNAGMPYLAGSCRGFGFDMTGESHMHSSEKSDALSESRLFDLGWKDDCFFYGAADAFMCHPRTCSERRLLHTVEQEQRGRTQSFVIATGEEETLNESEGLCPAELCDEDCLLPHQRVSSILTLPTHLFSLSKARSARDCLEIKQQTHYWRWVDLFDEIFFYVSRLQDQLFARGLSRRMADMLHECNHFDGRLVLDYVPMLRRMAVNEAAADRWYKSLSEKPDETTTTLRRTRRMRKEGRDHYFKMGAFRDYFDRRLPDLRDVNEVTETLCMSAIGVQMAN